MTINWRKLKTLDDFHNITAPWELGFHAPEPPEEDVNVLRMLVQPKYSHEFPSLPEELRFLGSVYSALKAFDTGLTGIKDKWGYITVRHGQDTFSPRSSAWHMDGASLRTELIPERNYVWVSNDNFEYKTGVVCFPKDYDPTRRNLFHAIGVALGPEPAQTAPAKTWLLVHPFCFHRKAPEAGGTRRTFIRITFTDIEIRDVNCTQNPRLPTEAFGRDSVKMFRDGLEDR